jgi:hypothetical protein
VRVIDGSGTVEDVHERIREAVGSASEVGKA